MARKRISELPLDNAVIGTDVVPIVSDGATKRVQLATLGTYFATVGGGQPASHAASHGQGGSDAVTVAIGQVTGLQTALDAKATPADVTTAVNAVIDAAPAALNTLNELAAALGDDSNFASTVTTALAGKAAAVHTHVIADVTGLQTALDGKQASGSYAAATHSHGSITSDGHLGTTAGQIVVTGFGGLVGTASSITPGQVVTETTYTNFLPTGGSLATAFSGIDSAISGKAASSHTHDGSAITSGTVNINRLPSNVVRTTAFGSYQYLSAGVNAISTEHPALPEGELPGDLALLNVSYDAGGVFVVTADGNATLYGTGAFVCYAITLNGTDLATTLAGKAATSHTHTAYSEIVDAILEDSSSALIDIGAAPLSHAHGAITSDGKVGSTAGLVLKTGTAGAVEALAQGTAGQVLKVNSGATGVEWGAAAADVSIDASAADVLSASSGSITADDAGADKLVFWDDSAGKLTYLAVSTGLSISGTTFTASVSASDISQGTLAYARMSDPTVTSPSQITASQNDYASFARGINRFTTNAARDITGMAAGSDGEIRVLCNVGTTAANTLTIKDESTSSTAANRFSVPWNGDCVIPAEGSVVVFYDNTSSRWRVV